MFILLIEDEADFIDEMKQIIEEMPGSIHLSIARSRNSAFDILGRKFFDLVILDLKIPTIDDALDADPTHGHAVFSKLQSVVPGTPILVLTGSPAEDFIQSMLDCSQQVDIWCSGRKSSTISFLRKFNIVDCPSLLRPIVDDIQSLNDIELDRDDDTPNLGREYDRLIRIFTKKFGGTYCRVSLLGGGLSAAKVVRLRITDARGALLFDAIAKLGSPDEIQSEHRRFELSISRLDGSATPRKLATLEFGAGSKAGNFYSLAKGFELSGFDLATQGEDLVAVAISNVEQSTKPWLHGVGQDRRTVRDIRRRLLADAVAEEVSQRYGIKWIREFEDRSLQTCWACIHGDLHGSNVLVSSVGATVLIDYGDVGEGPASLDPITLELSLIFHPQGPLKDAWPSIDQAHQWGNLDVYLDGCPTAAFIRECRSWAKRVAVGPREVAASAYSYLIRQLKYGDTDKAKACALLKGVYDVFSKST